MIITTCLFFFLLLVLRYFAGDYIRVSTSDGAIIMAAGIVMVGALRQFPWLASAAGGYLPALLLAFLLFFICELIRDAVAGSFYSRHLRDPVKSFAAGTWVAAVSVTIKVLMTMSPELAGAGRVLFVFDLLLAAGFLLIVLRNYRQLLSTPSLLSQAQGVLLHGCVFLQSLVIAGTALYGKSFPAQMSTGLILTGLLFYAAGLCTLLYRYRNESLLKNWDVTNTILFGGLSITGMALISSHPELADTAAVVWLGALLFLIFVESLDIVNGVMRLRTLGWRKAFMAYHPAQWARIFTLGMFLMFTLSLRLDASFLGTVPLFGFLQRGITAAGPPLILLLFGLQVLVSLEPLWNRLRQAKADSSRQQLPRS